MSKIATRMRTLKTCFSPTHPSRHHTMHSECEAYSMMTHIVQRQQVVCRPDSTTWCVRSSCRQLDTSVTTPSTISSLRHSCFCKHSLAMPHSFLLHCCRNWVWRYRYAADNNRPTHEVLFLGLLCAQCLVTMLITVYLACADMAVLSTKSTANAARPICLRASSIRSIREPFVAELLHSACPCLPL